MKGMSHMRCRVIVPVQDPKLALPRADLSPRIRSALVEAMAKDTLRVLAASRSVHSIVVVSPTQSVASLAMDVGAEFVLSESGTGINDAVTNAFRRTRLPSDQLIAAVAADLPAIRTDEVDEFLGWASRSRDAVHLTDFGGVGVTCHAERAASFTPCLAPDPALRRRPRGADANALLPGARCDVDTIEGLRVAAFMGVGPSTSAVMRALPGFARRQEQLA